MLMEVASGSTANGREVIQWQPNGGDNQQWKLNRVADNIYTLVSVKSGLCLDVPNSRPPRTCNSSSEPATAAPTSSSPPTS